MSHALVAVRRGRRHVAQLRLRRPIRDKPSGYLRFAALATKPGEKCGLVPIQKLWWELRSSRCKNEQFLCKF
jgi:hypothetical protein